MFVDKVGVIKSEKVRNVCVLYSNIPATDVGAGVGWAKRGRFG